MRFPSAMSENEIERLLAGRGPASGDPRLEEVATFVRALSATVPEPAPEPDPALISLIARLAETGPTRSTLTAEATQATPAPARRRSRLGLVAKLGVAAASIPVLFAGLAVAGVTLPGPAQDAFEEVGIELPNQPGDDSDNGGSGSGEDAGQPAKQRGSSNGKGEATRRSRRQAHGPSRSARPNPPGKAVRRGPNDSPGTPRGKPEGSPGGGSSGGTGTGGGGSGGSSSGGSGQGKAVGQGDGRGKNG
jgi:hypothetical protein